MNKKGDMTIGQIVKLILAVAVVVVLLVLVARIFVPIFDKGDETAKSYFETLEKEIKVADGGEKGEFFMWYLGDSNVEYYLVYFGKAIEVDFVKMRTVMVSAGGMGVPPRYEDRQVDVNFNSFGTKDNRICVCVVKGYESSCKYCEDLDHPVSYAGKDDIWYDESGKRISIELKGDEYVFAEIE